MRRQRFIALGSTILVLALAACNRSDAPPAGAEATKESAARPAAAPAATAETAFITYTAILKREASDQARVDDGKGKQVANWLATLYRGEKVNVVKIAQGPEGSDHVMVKTSNDLAGWVKSNALLAGGEVREATVLEQIDTFDRPDMLTLNTKRKVAAGTLLFVTKQREQFCEVNVGGTQVVWVLTARLVAEANEIMVSKLLAKARALKEGRSEGVQEILNLARGNFGEARLLEVMEKEFGVTAPAPAAAAEGAAAEAKPAAQ